MGRAIAAANQRVLAPLARFSADASGALGRTADAAADYFSLVNRFGKGPVMETGARVLPKTGLAEVQARQQARRAYDAIRRSTDDVAQIAKATGRSEAEIAQIKNYVFREEHQLTAGLRRFDPDPKIAAAWQRLEKGVHNAQDLALLEHELAESMLMKAGLSQQAAHVAAAGARNAPPGIGPTAAGSASTIAGSTAKAARYGGPQQRQALLNLIGEAKSLAEAKGLVYGFKQMRRLGYSLEDVSLAYRGRQGVDAVFSRGSNYAILESKHGLGVSSLDVYSGLRQGSALYNRSRLLRYLQYGDSKNDALVRMLLQKQAAGQLESFASFYRWQRLYELPPAWPVTPTMRR
jgi:hypothetical protein